MGEDERKTSHKRVLWGALVEMWSSLEPGMRSSTDFAKQSLVLRLGTPLVVTELCHRAAV